MSTVASVTSGTVQQPTTQAGSSELGKDTFLRLLTTQMQNQDPLNPMANEDFIAQLAQFSSLEQLQGVNSQLEGLSMINTSMNNASMVNLLGQEVVAVSDSFPYDGEGEQELLFQSGGEITGGTAVIRDEDGTVVATVELGSYGEGEQRVTWDGKDESGQPVPEGTYSVSYTATDVNGDPVDVVALVSGVVDELSFASGSPEPSISGVPISIGNILRLAAKQEPES